jgi:3-hydroxy-9,10-secoandrosta-1,3,5(10)-triene-9,17-dione monooxygenase
MVWQQTEHPTLAPDHAAAPGPSPLTFNTSMTEARALSAWLSAQSQRIDDAGRLPSDVVDRLVAAGMFNLTVPARLGGLGMVPHQAWRVVIELARGSASAAWVVSLCAGSHLSLARMSDAMQRQLFCGPAPAIASVLTGVPPRGFRAEPAQGGVVVSGEWGYASGIDAASWVGILIPGSDGGETRFGLVPQDRFTIDHASWNVLGMRGTGSKTVKLPPTFVPDACMMAWPLMQAGGRHPDCSSTSLLDAYPTNPLFAMSILAPTLGVANAIVDEFKLVITRRRKGAFDAAREAHLVSAYAEAAAQVSLAADSLVHEAKTLLEVLEGGGSFPIAARGECRMRLVLMARSGVTAAQRLLTLAGGQILVTSSRLEQLFRDLHAMSSHLLLQPEPVAQACGRLELGLEPLADVRF